MINYQALPTTFKELRKKLPINHTVSERLLEPFIRIDREENRIIARLGGVRVTREKRYEFLAPSNDHSWVIDGNIIRPLPRDISELMLKKIGDNNPDNLPFTVAIQLMRNSDKGITTVVTEGLLVAGKDAAFLDWFSCLVKRVSHGTNISFTFTILFTG